MKKHPHHDLWLHDDDELTAFLGSRVCQRITLHEWPLSNVEKVTCEDGRRTIYKSQYGPTVEPQFYARAKSPLLPQAKTLWQSGLHVCMLIEFIDAPLVRDLNLSGKKVLSVAKQIIGQIRGISGDPPVFLDISAVDKWMSLVDDTITDLGKLVEQGKFSHVNMDTVRSLADCARCDAVIKAIADDTGLIHDDTNRSNIFLASDGYRVVDWQRPKRGPRGVDLAAFLYDHKLDPFDHVNAGVASIFYFLRVVWLTQCKMRWIPEARDYDAVIVDFARRLRRVRSCGKCGKRGHY